jgi:hypothetical protein
MKTNKNNIFGKGIVLVIICLFIGAGVAPSISGNSKMCGTICGPEEETEYYAIIAACSEYKNQSHNLPPPPFEPISEDILKNLYCSLVDSDNWNESHIILLLNENATKKNITNAFEEMAGRVGPQDIFLFSWSGHGTLVPDEDGDESLIDPDDKYDEAICPYDAELVTDMLTDDELDFYFSSINAKGMCLFFESCVSGGIVSENTDKVVTDLAHDIIRGNFNSYDIDGTNRIVIMSTRPNRVCTLGASGFSLTNSMAKSFGSLARDSNGDGFISAEEAFKIARRLYIVESSMPYIMYWLSAYISIKSGLYRLVYKIPILKYIYNIPLMKRIMEFLYNEKYPVWSATRLLAIYWLYQQYRSLSYNGLLMENWANIRDDYVGELPIIEV